MGTAPGTRLAEDNRHEEFQMVYTIFEVGFPKGFRRSPFAQVCYWSNQSRSSPIDGTVVLKWKNSSTAHNRPRVFFIVAGFVLQYESFRLTIAFHRLVLCEVEGVALMFFSS